MSIRCLLRYCVYTAVLAGMILATRPAFATYEILVIGDSISDTVNDGGMSTGPYCTVSELTCTNIALAATTVATWVSTHASARADPEIPAIVNVSIALGVNSAALSVAKATWKASMEALIALLEGYGATKIHLHYPSYITSNGAFIDDYYDAIDEIAAANAVVFTGVDARGLGLTGDTTYKQDGIHWTQEGHDLFADAFDYTVVPEPGTTLQLATATLTLGLLSKWRTRKRSSTARASSTS